MITKILARLAAPIACMALLASSVGAASPTSYADDSNQYNAYVYSYISMVYADGIANVMKDDGVEGEVAVQIADLCDAGFMHCFDALVDDDDTLWQAAVDDLEWARLLCNTLIVFAEDSQPSSTIKQIKSLMRNLDIAIDNAEAAVPKQRFIGVISPWWP